MERKKILIIDDSVKICSLIKDFGEDQFNYEIDVVHSISTAIDKLVNNHYALLTLDIELGNENGLVEIEQIKKYFTGPIIFVSCIGEIEKIIEGLKKGADDYITKPFDMMELFLRIERSIERANNYVLFKVENYEIDRVKNIVYLDGEELEIGEQATKVLILLLDNANQILSRDEIIEKIWGTKYGITARVVDTYISGIRKATQDGRIRSIRSVGYKFES